MLFQDTCFWLPETDFLHRMWLHALKEVKSEEPICTSENVTLCYWHLIFLNALTPGAALSETIFNCLTINQHSFSTWNQQEQTASFHK